MAQEQYQKLKEYLNRTKGKRYPFTGHFLETQESYVKNSWMKILCMLLQSGRRVSEEQTFFLERLIAGCHADYDIQTYMRQGLEIRPEMLEEFITLVTDNTEGNRDRKRYSFVTDAVLLLHLGETDDETGELLAQMCGALRFTPEEMARTAGICAKILQMDMAGCILYDMENKKDLPSQWNVYLSHWDDVRMFQTNQYSIVTAVQKTAAALDKHLKITSFKQKVPNSDETISGEQMCFQDKDLVYLWKLEIPMSQHLCFKNIQRVVLYDCNFTGGDQTDSRGATSIWFQNCESVKIEDCSFQTFKGRTIYSVGTGHIQTVGTTISSIIQTTMTVNAVFSATFNPNPATRLLTLRNSARTKEAAL